MKITGGEWAYQFLRFNPAYVEDCSNCAAPAPEEPAPFPASGTDRGGPEGRRVGTVRLGGSVGR